MGGTLSGTVVRSETLEPVSGLEIRVFRASEAAGLGEQERFTQTDASGTFLFQDLPSGSWVVEYRTSIGISGELQADVFDDALTALDIEIGPVPTLGVPEELLQTSWRLIELSGLPFRERVTLTLSKEGRFEGEAPCNNFKGTFRGQWPDLRFEELEATELACDELEAEQAFFAALRQVDRADFSGMNAFTLTGPAGVSLRFEP